MKEEILKIKEKTVGLIDNASDLKSLEDIRVKVLGKKGDLTLVLRNMGKLSKEERPVMGQLANEVRSEIEELLSNKFEQLKQEQKKIKLKEEELDVTANRGVRKISHRHPLNETIIQLENLFQTMGFDIVDGPEIDTVENTFDLLNSPKYHPSRSLSDTFYLDDKTVLRPHTSSVQIRTMKDQKPPIRMVSAGRTFRFDDVDDTHSPMFHQIEGLVVDKGVTMANLMDTINIFIKNLFGEEIETRFRPHYFPFTEPSMEVDVTCFDCKGEGCPSCNDTGWSMELLGCGMVHPNVLRNCGIDPEVYTGFAFGMGVDRITMVKHKIDNIRLLYDNDKRFLEQF
ncbi:phenylalanine--tRNA ligase subunit alpha [Finegoldia sp. BIOML-A3]|uniref:phenylalanine--tRNA ligase subunit alpha n=1 Tax=Finegoldia TaxID=150022 RepID=UPI0012AFBDA5|nr:MULTISPECIES: phenylalanine--tRNA ligase subunit alpha [Finegoldia]MBS5360100.1 phenylalanine--tRNA ligase subunit alpha [Finegoldia magna]MBS5970760.1 phenylalanine--tRNA ligase subunit alpha [Finegoldia magna]MSA98117.1 phenylalanine--tRNA ligase subunit alpha [Finegoldia sp. BIOML-A3]MSB10759.1 phenylalanine--tRNA ligase subunit alpha [Finegoldia sp. BIOML-A1]MSB92125.1 phenylalanine--tRNA ligase subunit alpha [Finegoldia sp. BIOML-A4]